MVIIDNTIKYEIILGTFPFCKNFKSDDIIDEMNMDRNSNTTISLATFNPAIITTDVAR